MAFRGQPVIGAPAFATPTGAVHIGDVAVAGAGPAAASSQHVHQFPAPGAGYATYIAVAPADGADTTPARAGHTHGHRAADHQAGGFADLTGQFVGGAELVVHVKRVGALGNGVADDAAAIQSAIDAANAAGGGIVYLPPGIYRVTALLLLRSNVHLIGAGRGATIIKLANGINPVSAVGIIQPLGYTTAVGPAGWYIENVSVRHLTVDGNKANNPTGVYEGVELSFVKNGLIFDVEAHDCRECGIHVQASNTGTDQPGGTPRVIACTAHHNTADGFQVGGVIASDLYAYLNSGAGIHVTGNYSGATAAQVANIAAQITASRAEQNQTGVTVDLQTGPAIATQLDAVTAVNNTTAGFYLNMDHIAATNVVARNNGNDGFFVAAADVTIAGFKSVNNGQTAATGNFRNAGVTLFGTLNRLVLKDGASYDDQAAKTQLYGISFNAYAAGTVRNTIEGVNTIGNATGAVDFLGHVGDYFITKCPGVNGVGRFTGVGILPATPAVPGSAAVIVNNSPVDVMIAVTPSTANVDILVSGVKQATAAASGATVWVRAPAGQSVQLNYSVAPTWIWVGE